MICAHLPQSSSVSPSGATASPPSTVKLLLDDVCQNKLDQGKLYERDLRKIFDYSCCRHVAYAKFNCQDKDFFFKKQGQTYSAVPGTCPFRDGGRLLPQTVNEI